MEKQRFSIKRRYYSFGYAWKGIKTLFTREHNMMLHGIIALGVIAAGFVLGLSAGEWISVALVIGAVFTAEAFNTAIEALCDKISPQMDEKIGMVKDIAAGGVLIAVIAAIITGLIIFLPKIAHSAVYW